MDINDSRPFRARQTAIEFLAAQRARDPQLLQHARELAEVAGQPPSQLTLGLISMANHLIDELAKRDGISPSDVLAAVGAETESIAQFVEDGANGG